MNVTGLPIIEQSVSRAHRFHHSSTAISRLNTLKGHHNNINKPRMSRFLWYDPHIFNAQNSQLHQHLSLLNIPAQQHCQTHTLTESIECAPGVCQPRITVISSSSVPEGVLECLGQNEMVREVVIYCWRRQKGEYLKSRSKKIHRVIVDDYELIDYLKHIQKSAKVL